MGLLHEIQDAVMRENSELGPILLKVRFLAACLDSQPLAEWIKHESEGYPPQAPLPEYRRVAVSYRATFSGPFGSGIKNAPIAPALINELAGEQWVKRDIRQSIAAVDELLASSAEKGSITIDASNLIFLLQGKVYEGYACNAVYATIGRSSLAEIRHIVKSRVLELTIELKKAVPEATKIELGTSEIAQPVASSLATQISQQIIYGNVTAISASDNAKVGITISKGDIDGFINRLTAMGVTSTDAKELASLIKSEGPESSDEPLGSQAKKWLVDNIKKAANGTWKIGVSVATEVIKDAALRYYGLK